MSLLVIQRTARPRRGRAGFKLIEVMVASAVLMIGSIGLLQLHGTIVRGIASSEDFSVALDVANQRLEELVIVGATALPVCTAGLNGPGCQPSIGAVQATTNVYTPPIADDPSGYACTRFVDSTEVIMATVPPTPVPAGSRFRVDTVVQAHPDPGLFPDGRLVTVSVCWFDLSNQVRQVQSRRYVVPEA
jgi:hypothetical protein